MPKKKKKRKIKKRTSKKNKNRRSIKKRTSKKKRNKIKTDKIETPSELIFKSKPEWIRTSLANKAQYQKNTMNR